MTACRATSGRQCSRAAKRCPGCAPRPSASASRPRKADGRPRRPGAGWPRVRHRLGLPLAQTSTSRMTTPAAAVDRNAKLPRQIPYIIGNEGCERFSFYGMRNILVPFLVSSLLLAYLPESEREGTAKDIFHTFVIGVYFFPLLGGWISDRWFGKYNTVFWLSLVYCAGHACLALFEDSRGGFYTGLFLIALGSGGIKPLVSA